MVPVASCSLALRRYVGDEAFRRSLRPQRDRISGAASALARENQLDLAFIAGIDAAIRYNQMQAIDR